ncbi:carboxylesterase family domain-containing protein [Ditylenchus destructor]|uniref:Carboxylesterase family domain-containing protein n=1 Tax=Ditylenchus destructor TaxID=166010 RepID=A0AAD4R402_9BILA|nr:carboxylesterase family domain-containing protein [Ditylenchus destructor]
MFYEMIGKFASYHFQRYSSLLFTKYFTFQSHFQQNFSFLLICYITVYCNVDADTTQQVRKTHPIELTIESGSIRGEYLTIGANDFAVFKGIPYAAPPVGSLRFQKPEPPAKWRGVMNATQYPPMCAQKARSRSTDPIHLYKIHISEDCLYLNVFAPPQFTNDTYPVIVWIHGGGFQSGSSSDYPQEAILNNFVSRKVIFVSMNYRLGPLGFLSTGDSTLPGNNGLRDQILALEWVKVNAHVFGGDPNNILLMGQGSGASAASLLALSPKAEGLFQKIMLMSGTAISPGVVRTTAAINGTWALDKKLHCRSFNSSELLDCFRKQLRDEILDFEEEPLSDYNTFVPVVDGEDGVIPESPEVLATYRRKIPVMLGTTKDESSLNLLLLNRNDLNLTSVDTDLAEILVDNLTKAYGFINQPLITEGCKHEYIWTKVDPADAEKPILYESMLKMFSQFWHDAPAARLATYYSRQEVPVFLYSFDHVSENFETDRVFHGIDEIFLFDVEPRFLVTRRDKNWQLDQRVTEIFADLIVNFLKYDNPTPDQAGFTFNWTTMLNDNQLNFLSITDTPTVAVGFRWQGHVFWNKYVKHLDSVDVGNLQKIAQLDKQLGDYQLATWMLLFCALFFFAILVGLACYCTRKEVDEDEL